MCCQSGVYTPFIAGSIKNRYLRLQTCLRFKKDRIDKTVSSEFNDEICLLKSTKESVRWRDAIRKIRRILLLCCLTAYANVMSLHEKANGQQQKQQIPSKKVVIFAIRLSPFHFLNPPKYTLFAPSPGKSCIGCYFQILPGRTAKAQEHMKKQCLVREGGLG